VEDDYLLAEMLGPELENVGFTTQTAISAADVGLVAQETAPDVIISDFYLRITNGLDLIKNLKNKKLLIEPIFLLMSGSAEAKQLARKAGIGFVEKPFNLDQILAEIEHQTKDTGVTYSLKNSIASMQESGFGKKV